MFCQKCGNNVPDRNVFCTVCGAPVSPVSTPELIPEPASAPIQSATPVASPQKTYSESKLNTKTVLSTLILVAIIILTLFLYLKYIKTGKSLSTGTLVVFGGIFVALVGLLIFFLFKKEKTGTYGTVPVAYNLAVNPNAVTTETASTSFNSGINENPSYSMPSSVNFPTESNKISPEHNFGALSEVNNNIETLYSDPETVRTRYAPGTPIEPKKNVEIVFSPETIIPSVDSNEFSFTPGVAAKHSVPDAPEVIADDRVVNPEEPITGSKVQPTSEVSAVTGIYAETDDAVMHPVSESPAIASEPETTEEPSNPFLKSAGDL